VDKIDAMGMVKTFWRGIIDKLPPPFRNRYVVAATLFLTWMIFFDSANLMTQLRLIQSVNNLQRDKEYYQEEIIKAEAEKKTLAEDKETFAREKYYLQKSNEEVFILEEED
jgi:cell division protein DivIC